MQTLGITVGINLVNQQPCLHAQFFFLKTPCHGLYMLPPVLLGS